ncbi:MAG TPA: 3-isopropylmalate dehydrogenase, partial [Polyangia bacterium]
EAVRVLRAVATQGGHELRFTEHLMGGCSIDAHGTALTDEVLAACKASDAVLLGAVGGPKWDDPTAKVRPEQGLLGLRRALGLYANIRPVRPHPALADASPLKNERLEGVDLVFVRELTGGLYFGKRGRDKIDGGERAFDTLEYTDGEVRRVVRLAFRLASERKQRVTSIDKANVLESSRLWRQTATAVAKEFPSVALDHQLVDSAAMRLVTTPAAYDVIVTENMFGDILTDEASVLAGSLGLLPSASLGDSTNGLYEPIHGSAPDIANRGIANPIGTIASAALLLRHSLGAPATAARIERAIDRALADGLRTADLGGTLGTDELTRAVVERL